MATADASAGAPPFAPGEVALPRGPGVLRRALRYRRTKLGIGLTVLIALVALVGPLVAPHAPDDFVGPPLDGPSATALLGTDQLGQDVLSRVLHGGRNVLWMSVVATTLGMVVGTTIGLLAAYSRPWLDETLMRSTDLVLAFPQIVLVLLFVSLIGPRLWLIVLLVALAWAPQIARVTRGATLEVVGREFVQSAEALGVRRRRILTRELLPNVATPLLVEFGLRLTWSIALIAGISFLGFGIQPPAVDWGLMINESRTGLTVQPWAVLAPVVCIGAFTIGTNSIAEGVSRAISGIDLRVPGST